MSASKRLPRDPATAHDSATTPRRGSQMLVTVERTADPADLTTFADAYARIVQRLATQDGEAMQHAG